MRTLTHQWVGPDGQPAPVLQSDQISHSAEGVAYLNMAKLGPMVAGNICPPRPMAIVTRGSLADLQKLEKGKQIINRVCEVSYTYVCSDDKILPARGLLLQFGTGDIKQRETKHDFEVPVDSRVEMTLTSLVLWFSVSLSPVSLMSLLSLSVSLVSLCLSLSCLSSLSLSFSLSLLSLSLSLSLLSLFSLFSLLSLLSLLSLSLSFFARHAMEKLPPESATSSSLVTRPWTGVCTVCSVEALSVNSTS